MTAEQLKKVEELENEYKVLIPQRTKACIDEISRILEDCDHRDPAGILAVVPEDDYYVCKYCDQSFLQAEYEHLGKSK